MEIDCSTRRCPRNWCLKSHNEDFASLFFDPWSRAVVVLKNHTSATYFQSLFEIRFCAWKMYIVRWIFERAPDSNFVGKKELDGWFRVLSVRRISIVQRFASLRERPALHRANLVREVHRQVPKQIIATGSSGIKGSKGSISLIIDWLMHIPNFSSNKLLIICFSTVAPPW